MIKKYEHGHARTKGTPQITWIAEILEGDFIGQSLYEVTYMIEASLWKVTNLLAATGLIFPIGVDTDSPFFDQLCQDALGRSTYWLVVQETYEGKIKNDITDYAIDKDQESLEVSETLAKGPDWVEK